MLHLTDFHNFRSHGKLQTNEHYYQWLQCIMIIIIKNKGESYIMLSRYSEIYPFKIVGESGYLTKGAVNSEWIQTNDNVFS